MNAKAISILHFGFKLSNVGTKILIHTRIVLHLHIEYVGNSLLLCFVSLMFNKRYGM